MLPKLAVVLFIVLSGAGCAAQPKTAATDTIVPANPTDARIIPAAEQLNEYLPLLKGKTVALLVNHTSAIGNTHLVDTLRKLGVNIKVVFGPEHGFRGDAPDGAKIESGADAKTGIPVVSLYGKKNKPSPEDLQGVDIMLYDIQDVGTRFYTFISSMQYFMEAALETNTPLIILDRPNPNGFYVDGPVLKPAFKSFVGLQPVPVVYGMTIGEYATMLLMEKWLGKEANEAYERVQVSRYPAGAKFFQLRVIPVKNYTHNTLYPLPIKPSPNLPYMSSVLWYPSTCFFEGTTFSEGRGTAWPFEYIGHPQMPKTFFAFTPKSTTGAPNPKHKDNLCYGFDLRGDGGGDSRRIRGRLELWPLLEAYKAFSNKEEFFNKSGSFNRLAGTDELMAQVIAGKPEEEIRKSWEPGLNAFKKIRKNYLLYPDFE